MKCDGIFDNKESFDKLTQNHPHANRPDFAFNCVVVGCKKVIDRLRKFVIKDYLMHADVLFVV